ncbi:hypothetical protein KFK09_021300 [Dendrobium nobile]|uniref:Retrovirus-related Pol polyprotein from transposon TNT 1-94 n=1 Tax=Dendrobium nobile TaxID=94219 RepID=A0A8T3ANW2_DENNO|nr:hypothetical protein KFK09_021300 [Dendrobium nobile]
MGDNTMNQYLVQIKAMVDNIAVTGSQLDSEDIILYILNGLLSTYNSFKTTIQTSLNPMSLDILYSLLCSEEINIHNELLKDTTSLKENLALYSPKTGSIRDRNNHSNQSCFTCSRVASSKPSFTVGHGSSSPTPMRQICQICHIPGHSAASCWHRYNLQYTPNNSWSPRALLTSNKVHLHNGCLILEPQRI